METAKRTYAIPSRTLNRFEGKIAPGRRSAKVAELIEDWIHEQEREALRQDIIEGCRDMGEIYLEMAKEWEPLEEEIDRAFRE